MDRTIDDELRDLYGRFEEEMDRMELPSEDELLSMINHTAEKISSKEGVMIVPHTPQAGTGRTKRMWLSIAASLLLFVVGGGLYLFVGRNDRSPVYVAENRIDETSDLITTPAVQNRTWASAPPTATPKRSIKRTTAAFAPVPQTGTPTQAMGGSVVASMAEPPDEDVDVIMLESVPIQAMPPMQMTVAMADTVDADSLMVSKTTDVFADTLARTVFDNAYTVFDNFEKSAVAVPDSTIKQDMKQKNDCKTMKNKEKCVQVEKKKKFFWEQKENKDKNVNMYQIRQYNALPHPVMHNGGRFTTVYY